MEDTKKYYEDLCCLKKELIRAAMDECSRGVQNVDTREMGQVVDMIKDLAEAEKECWEACYYKSIVHGMHEEEEEMRRSGGRMGYDNWRYSSGRFAPTGRGHRSGFTPMGDYRDDMRDGWEGDSRGREATMGSHDRMGYSGHPRGDRYERYHQARMGYHESKDPTSRQHMDSAARDYVVDMAEVVKEIWKDADPAMRKELKNKVVALSSELN